MDNEEVWFNDYKSKQGNIGLGQAIAYYMSKGYVVLFPINDTQPYDLVIDKLDGNGLQRISVKTTRYIHRKHYVVQLGNTGGSSGNNKIRFFDNNASDLIFIFSISQERWEIPSKHIEAKRSITLGEKYDKYRI